MSDCFVGQTARHELHDLALPKSQAAQHLCRFTLSIIKPLNGLIRTISMQGAVDAARTLKFREITRS
jgi:hypothetical protein